jgi:TRAP-type C4-dicarboxylate transport system substrate-binding protein
MQRFIPSLAAAGLMVLSGSVMAQTKLVVSSWVPTNHHVTRIMATWCTDVASATANRVTCDVLPKSVAPPPKSADAVRDGLADVSFVIDGYLPNPPVLSAISGVPFPPAETTGESASVALQRMHNKYFSKFPEMRGLKVIAVWSGSPNNFSTVGKPINGLKDLEGMKIQAGSRDAVELVKLLGAVPVAKPVSETYEMLSTGIVDGVLAPLEGVKSFRLDKFVKVSRRTPIAMASLSMIMNQKVWDALSPQDQAAIDKLSGERLARAFGKGFDSVDAESIALLKAAGVEPTPLPEATVQAMKARVQPLEAAWINAAKGRGLDNAADVLTEYRNEIIKVAREAK